MEFPLRIYLIGFMGCGKSHSGQLLAQQLDYRWIDLDSEIEASVGCSVAALFSKVGEPAFREKEAEVLRQTASLQRVVISCGGGTPCFHDNMTWIKAHGLSVYLKASPALLTRRLLPERDQRPLLHGLTDAEVGPFIEVRLAQRASFYQQAHVVFEQDFPAHTSQQALAEYLETQLTLVYDQFPELKPNV